MNSVKTHHISGNLAVVHFPERRYPALAMQGDTFNGIVRKIVRCQQHLKSQQIEELTDELEYLEKDLLEFLQYYEKICEQENLGLPYIR